MQESHVPFTLFPTRLHLRQEVTPQLPVQMKISPILAMLLAVCVRFNHVEFYHLCRLFHPLLQGRHGTSPSSEVTLFFSSCSFPVPCAHCSPLPATTNLSRQSSSMNGIYVMCNMPWTGFFDSPRVLGRLILGVNKGLFLFILLHGCPTVHITTTLKHICLESLWCRN